MFYEKRTYFSTGPDSENLKNHQFVMAIICFQSPDDQVQG